jgi:hypothetical protein
VRGTLVALWQDDATGVRPHPEDPRHAAVHPGCRGWGRVITDFDTGLWARATIGPAERGDRAALPRNDRATVHRRPVGFGSGAGRNLPLGPDTASLSVGANNFPIRAYQKPPDPVDGLASEMQKYDAVPGIEAFGLSHILTARERWDRGQLARRPCVHVGMGVKNALPANRWVFDFHVATVQRLFASGAPRCAAAIGPSQIAPNAWAIAAGDPRASARRLMPAHTADSALCGGLFGDRATARFFTDAAVVRAILPVARALRRMGEHLTRLAQTGIGAVTIAGAGGSSAMPQKANPVGPAALLAPARRIDAGQRHRPPRRACTARAPVQFAHIRGAAPASGPVRANPGRRRSLPDRPATLRRHSMHRRYGFDAGQGAPVATGRRSDRQHRSPPCRAQLPNPNASTKRANPSSRGA